MTDITGNFGINTSSYGKEVETDKSRPVKESHKEDAKANISEEKTNLNSNPASVSGRSLVKTSEVSFEKEREDEADELTTASMVLEAAENYKADLIASGCDKTIAAKKAYLFAKNLLENGADD